MVNWIYLEKEDTEMKKSFKTLLMGVTLAAAMTVSAGAANFTDSADKLSDMGLFSGTQLGYELDRAPTRAEASVMLVRLLGGEQEAMAGTFETPFTDVPTWAAPYVGWLYENGLTAGATATTFDPQGTCSAQMYSAFLVRSLGYNESAGDFTYAKAVDFATEKGVADYLNCNESNFLRDNVAAMSYTALSVQPKDQAHATLLDQLVADKAIDAAKAAAAQKEFATFREYDALMQKANQQTKMAMDIKMDMNAKMNNADMMTGVIDMDVQADVDIDNMDASKMSMIGTMSMEISPALVGEGAESTLTSPMEMYFTDGYCYVNANGVKQKMAMSLEEVMAGFGDMLKVQSNPITFYKSIVKNSDGSFTAAYSGEAFAALFDSLLGPVGMDTAGMKIDGLESVEMIDADGNLKSMTMNMDMSMSVQGQSISITMKMDCDVTGTGSAVTVTMPSDLDSYSEIEVPAV